MVGRYFDRFINNTRITFTKKGIRNLMIFEVVLLILLFILPEGEILRTTSTRTTQSILAAGALYRMFRLWWDKSSQEEQRRRKSSPVLIGVIAQQIVLFALLLMPDYYNLGRYIVPLIIAILLDIIAFAVGMTIAPKKLARNLALPDELSNKTSSIFIFAQIGLILLIGLGPQEFKLPLIQLVVAIGFYFIGYYYYVYSLLPEMEKRQNSQ